MKRIQKQVTFFNWIWLFSIFSRLCLLYFLHQTNKLERNLKLLLNVLSPKLSPSYFLTSINFIFFFILGMSYHPLNLIHVHGDIHTLSFQSLYFYRGFVDRKGQEGRKRSGGESQMQGERELDREIERELVREGVKWR